MKNTILNKKEFSDAEYSYVLKKAIRKFHDNEFNGFGNLNTLTLRRVIFFKYLIGNLGNATKAAIYAGYSPRSAKQQGHRLLRWVQNQLAKEGATKVDF
jgi:hypothetical protein